MHALLLFTLLIIVAIWLLVSRMTVATIRKLGDPEPLLRAVPIDTSMQTASDWPAAHAYEPDSQFRFDGLVGVDALVDVYVWHNPETHTYLVSYAVMDKAWWEFVTLFRGQGDEVSAGLTTSSADEALTMPTPPGHFIQAFERLDRDGLLARHQEGIALLQDRMGLRPVNPAKGTREMIIESIERQIAYVKRIPYWYLKGPYWYFIRRRRLVNKPIAALLSDTLPG